MHCHFCSGKLIWGSDFSFEDFCMDGDGIVATLTCSNCGADWQGYLPLDEDGEAISE